MLQFLLLSVVKTRAIKFEYRPSTTLASVYIVGTFNGWDKSVAPMHPSADGKSWSATLRIEPGIYQYLFVEDGKRWVPDPKAKPMDDGNSNQNSILVVTPEAFDLQPGVVGDGHVTSDALRHRANRADTIRLSQHRYGFNLRVRANDVEQVYLETESGSTEAHKIDANDLYEIWRAEVDLTGGTARYRFVVRDGARTVRWPSQWIEQDLGRYPLPSVPDWVADQVFYQIFPDRFCNGDRSNDGASVQPWGTKPTGSNRMGGDLAGVQQKLDYLQDLGATAILFNPLFVSGSNHGYDTYDYTRIDPRFGTNAQFKDLVAELKRRNMKVVLDGVFNHSGVDFFAFKSLRELGAASPYRDWYTVYKFPLVVAEGQRTYRAWFGVTSLPRLRTEGNAVRKYFYDVAAKWLTDFGVDGWRLDAADQVGHAYWKGFRKTVRSASPEAWILTEIWGDCHDSLQGDESDNQMNYRWRNAVHDFFGLGKIKAREFQRRLEIARGDVPEAAWLTQFNLLGSHDTERFRTIFKGDSSRQKQAVLFQMTYPGVPCVYYGDELGLEGGKDPDCRRCMPWDPSSWDVDLHRWTKGAIQFRLSNSALRRGAFSLAQCEDVNDIYAFTRTDLHQSIFIAFCGDSPATIDLPKGRDWRLAIGPCTVHANKVELPARGAVAFVRSQ